MTSTSRIAKRTRLRHARTVVAHLQDGRCILAPQDHLDVPPAGGRLARVDEQVGEDLGDEHRVCLQPHRRGRRDREARETNGGSSDASVRWGPKALASKGAVFGLGVDVLGRSLVITDGSAKFGAGSISGQWFDKDGTPLTDEFDLYDHFSAGPSTWSEVNALIGGGVLVRRMDGDGGGDTHLQLHSQALVTVDSGTAAVHSAPDWMVSRRDVRIQIARGGKAYAALPLQATNVACSTDYPIAAGNCDTEEVSLGLDGTLIQRLPAALEQAPDAEHHSCTWST